MRVVIASDADGMSMKESIKEMLIADGHEVVDYSETPAADFVDSATAVAKDLLEHKDSQGFAFDKYGVGSYMAAVKIKGMVVANISDERSAYMTREHNGSRHGHHGPRALWAPRSPRRSPASSCAPSTPAAVTRSVSTCSTRWPNESHRELELLPQLVNSDERTF